MKTRWLLGVPFVALLWVPLYARLRAFSGAGPRVAAPRDPLLLAPARGPSIPEPALRVGPSRGVGR